MDCRSLGLRLGQRTLGYLQRGINSYRLLHRQVASLHCEPQALAGAWMGLYPKSL